MNGRTGNLFRALAALDSICREPNDEALQLSSDDPLEGLRGPFVGWLDSTCTANPRCFGGVSSLHLDFCEWCIAHDEVPCTRDVFERLLSDLGFLIGEVSGTRLVSGLVLKADLDNAQRDAGHNHYSVRLLPKSTTLETLGEHKISDNSLVHHAVRTMHETSAHLLTEQKCGLWDATDADSR